MISLIALLTVFVSFQDVYSSNAIRLKDIQALTFRKNQLTTCRRSSPMQQLTCYFGDCRYSNYVDVVQCVNMGVNDNENVQWRCESQLPESLSLGKTIVSCEGYNHAGDEFVLKGSCALKYELVRDYAQPINPYHNTNNNGNIVPFIFLLCLLICAIICFTNCCTFSSSDSHTPPYYGWFGRYHGGSTYYTRQPLYQTNIQTNVSYADTEVRESTPIILSTLRQRSNHVVTQQPVLQEPIVTKVSYANTEIRGSIEKPIVQEPIVTKVSYADTEVRGEPVVEKNQDYKDERKTDISYADTESR